MTIVYAGQPDFDMLQQMIMESPSRVEQLIAIGTSSGWWGWIVFFCFAIGAITIICFMIGRGSPVFDKFIPVFSLVKRLLKTWSNLLKGK